MESHLGVKVPGPNFKGIESPDGLEVKRAGSKTIFEMIDLEGVSSSLLFLPFSSLEPTLIASLSIVSLSCLSFLNYYITSTFLLSIKT